jgi:hypothetical protein
MRGNLAFCKRSTDQPYTPHHLAQALAWDRLADIRKLYSAVNLDGLVIHRICPAWPAVG